jgi:hypothetical protein
VVGGGCEGMSWSKSSEELRLIKDISDLVSQWERCKAEKGKNNEECKRIRQQVGDKTGDLIEHLEQKYDCLCQGEYASSSKCRALAWRIKEMYKAIYDMFCKGDEESLYCQNLLDKIREWERRSRGRGGKEIKKSEGGVLNPSGVMIVPDPRKSEEGGKELKENTIESRPSLDSLVWPFEIPD